MIDERELHGIGVKVRRYGDLRPNLDETGPGWRSIRRRASRFDLDEEGGYTQPKRTVTITKRQTTNETGGNSKMPVLTMQENEVIPTGEYPVQVVDLEQETGTFGQQLKWKLEIIGGGDYAGKTLTAWASLSNSLKSKLAKWSIALGIQLDAGEELDTDDLIGRKAMATVVVKTKEDGSEFSKVEEIKAPKRRPAPKAEPKKAEAEAEEDDPFGGE